MGQADRVARFWRSPRRATRRGVTGQKHELRGKSADTCDAQRATRRTFSISRWAFFSHRPLPSAASRAVPTRYGRRAGKPGSADRLEQRQRSTLLIAGPRSVTVRSAISRAPTTHKQRHAQAVRFRDSSPQAFVAVVERGSQLHVAQAQPRLLRRTGAARGARAALAPVLVRATRAGARRDARARCRGSAPSCRPSRGATWPVSRARPSYRRRRARSARAARSRAGWSRTANGGHVDRPVRIRASDRKTRLRPL